MSNKPEKERQLDPPESEKLHKLLHDELKASKQTIEALNDMQLEEVEGGMEGFYVGNIFIPFNPISPTSTTLSGPPLSLPGSPNVGPATHIAKIKEELPKLKRSFSAHF